jgi:hypothetical protein
MNEEVSNCLACDFKVLLQNSTCTATACQAGRLLRHRVLPRRVELHPVRRKPRRHVQGGRGHQQGARATALKHNRDSATTFSTRTFPRTRTRTSPDRRRMA